MATWTTPTPPSVGTQAASSWADLVTADLALLASPAYFFGSLLTSTAITSGALINLTTIVEDSLSGWDATNHRYVFKSPGLYVVNVGIKANSTPVGLAAILIKNGVNLALTGNTSSVAFASQNFSITLRFAVNDTLGVTPIVNYTTQSDSPAHNNFLSITQVSWV